jgi:hypothetical protein
MRPSDARFNLFCWSDQIRLAFEHDRFGIRVWFINTEGSWAAFAVDLCTHRSLYSRVSFCDASLYDDSILRPLSSRTEHSWLVMHYSRNSSVLSLLSVLLTRFRCACVSSYSVLVQFYNTNCDFSIHDVHKKNRKEENIKTVNLTFSLDMFWTTAWTFFNKIESDLIDIFFNYLCNFLYT